MYKKIDIPQGELMLTKDDYGFKEVMNTFKSSSNITIVTYSIHKDLLLNLYSLDPNKEITIVTNIPSRYETYTSESQKQKAKKQIELTEHILDVSKFKAFTKTYFNFSNHSKIIISDTLAYIGSQNFYGQSSWECGYLTTSQSTIKEIRETFIKQILDNSLPYNYKYDLSHLIDVLELIKDLEGTLTEKLDIADTEYYECGVNAESIILLKTTFSHIVNNFIKVYNLLLKYSTPSSINNQFNICMFQLYESLKYYLGGNNPASQGVYTNTIDYSTLLSKALKKINTSNSNFCELYPINSAEDLLDNLSLLNCYVEDYIFDFYTFKNAEHTKKLINNTLLP